MGEPLRIDLFECHITIVPAKYYLAETPETKKDVTGVPTLPRRS